MDWWTGNLHDIDSDKRVDCDCVFGGTFIVRRSCIEQMGFFFSSDRFFASELELSTRVKRQGYRVLCEPQAIAYHKGARSTRNVNQMKFQYLNQKELTLFHITYNPFPQKLFYLAFSLAFCLKQALKGNRMHLLGLIDGIIMGYLHRQVRLPGTPIERKISVAEWVVEGKD
jgi:GT2 family glycosyltransferase